LLAATTSNAPAQLVTDVARQIESVVRAERVAEGAGTGGFFSSVTLQVYERRAFAPLWNPSSIARLRLAIDSSRLDGLTPGHYAIAPLRSVDANPVQLARTDLLATEALHQLSRDLRFGRVAGNEPPDSAHRASPFGGDDPVADLINLAGSQDIVSRLKQLRPQTRMYSGLMTALERMRRLDSAGGWQELPGQMSVSAGARDARVLLLRTRLAAEGYLQEAGAAGSDLFDEAVARALRAFQLQHGLNDDGILGAATLRELNIPAEKRIEQIRVNLERARWAADEQPDTLVLVNIAGATAYLIRHDSIAFTSRVVVGTSSTLTPAMRAQILFVDLNPEWTVPPGIVNEILASIRSDSTYLARMAIRVIDNQGGEVDPAGIDFRRYTASTFPYRFRQDPGPLNPLGQIRFVFPNANNVYLHDTPQKELFSQEQRLFSHGCIRLQNPLQLATLLLSGDPTWSLESLKAAIDLGQALRIQLPQPAPIAIVYWTATTEPSGAIHYYPDVYGRDTSVLLALDAVTARNRVRSWGNRVFFP
jgi:murein L,D-transpeptidase YcbB/YkuD